MIVNVIVILWLIILYYLLKIKQRSENNLLGNLQQRDGENELADLIEECKNRPARDQAGI